MFLGSRLAVLVGAGVLFLLSGCASTRITSQADPTIERAAYDTMMVYAAFEDLDLRKLGENELKTRLAARGVVCHKSSDVFFPGGAYEAQDLQDRLAALGIKAILVIAAYDAGTSETYVPPTYYTKGTAWVSGNQVSGRAATSTVGGYTYSKPWAKFRGDVFDVRSERRTWMATANSKGNRYASGNTLLRSFCGKTVIQLSADGVVPKLVSAARKR